MVNHGETWCNYGYLRQYTVGEYESRAQGMRPSVFVISKYSGYQPPPHTDYTGLAKMQTTTQWFSVERMPIHTQTEQGSKGHVKANIEPIIFSESYV